MSRPAHSCKISMLWNWTTLDACFLSRSWHVNTKAQFAGSVIGVFLLTLAIEAVRRLGREYDRRLILSAEIGSAASDSKPACSNLKTSTLDGASDISNYNFTPSWGQHILRSMIYSSQFTASFLVMLLGMYFNGYILFAIFLGHTFGYCAFGRDTCAKSGSFRHTSGNCC
ncbi:Copper transporter [Phaffia rhodozyma]|uniref:Copper transport protein n=1 Tax=Phaffia rhodozyma TaxID=264483 RepID=A0A0F7SRG7_PHARH|nr:Copper transporter [Phaffia rhodozyma]